MDNKAGQQGKALADSIWRIADILHGSSNQSGKVIPPVVLPRRSHRTICRLEAARAGRDRSTRLGKRRLLSQNDWSSD